MPLSSIRRPFLVAAAEGRSSSLIFHMNQTQKMFQLKSILFMLKQMESSFTQKNKNKEGGHPATEG